MDTFIGIILGAFFTWLVSWFFYKRASDDLKEKVEVSLNKQNKTLDSLMKFLNFIFENDKKRRDPTKAGKIVSASITYDGDGAWEYKCREGVQMPIRQTVKKDN